MLDQLVKLSNDYGSDPAYVLSGGGNTSLKDDTTLYVKGSGTQLATIGADGFVAMDRKKLDAMLEKEYPADDDAREAAALADMMAARLPGSGDKRPSVETPLHNLFPYRLVLHVHPALVNGLTCGKTGEADARRLFGDDMVWVPLWRPGYALSMLCRSKMAEYKQKTGRDAQILLLQNHGIFVAADTREEIDRIMRNVIEQLSANVTRWPDMDERDYSVDAVEAVKTAIQFTYEKPQIIYFSLNGEIEKLCRDRQSFAPLAEPFTPDHIVYCKAKFLFLDAAEDMEEEYKRFLDKYGYEPKVIFMKGLGAFALSPTEKEAFNASLLLNDAVQVAAFSESFGGPLPMTQELVDFILNWEVENYRQKVAKGN